MTSRHRERLPHTAVPQAPQIIRHRRHVFDYEKSCEAKARLDTWHECNRKSKEMEEECKTVQPGIDVHIDENVPNTLIDELNQKVADLRRKCDAAARKNAELKETESRNHRKYNHYARHMEKANAAHAAEIEKQKSLGNEAEDLINENTDLVVAIKSQREIREAVTSFTSSLDPIETLSSNSPLTDTSELSTKAPLDSASLASEESELRTELDTVKIASEFRTTQSMASGDLPEEFFRAPYRIQIPRRPPRPC